MRFTPTPVGTTTHGESPWTRTAVHPHARGDDRVRWRRSRLTTGSPPRPWGRLLAGQDVGVRVRFTPTPVGTTAQSAPAPVELTVHPHARGDDHSCSVNSSRYPGSPPRPWGRRWTRPHGTRRPRFTPTPVGTTEPDQRRESRLTVHPHARGDDPELRPHGIRHTGSPPRPWGRHNDPTLGWMPFRFTPTPVGTTLARGARRPPGPVHPHARGDDSILDPGQIALAGSPPRPWGRPCGLGPSRGSGRFTPTPVGTTWVRDQRRVPIAVHPHARGDDVQTDATPPRSIGSPPRPWGRRHPCAPMDRLIWFTPTPVGTTATSGPSTTAPTVHPHARGDDNTGVGTMAESTGSPPRPWGRRRGRDLDARGHRFTPTPVGTTLWRVGDWSVSPVHPHARGDDEMTNADRADLAGSPPRPWGRLGRIRGVDTATRFTPTPVGTTMDAPSTAAGQPVHPHARGDDENEVGRYVNVVGSPPRPWGRRRHGQRAGQRLRFTPTPVGTTECGAHGVVLSPVHPHARGDDARASNGTRCQPGSPPRPWGRLVRSSRIRMSGRFTPTPVGTTG